MSISCTNYDEYLECMDNYITWQDCIHKNNYVIRQGAEAYVLIPQAFGGGVIMEKKYECRGNFGNQNIFELIADWNKDFLKIHKNEIGTFILPKAERNKYFGLLPSEKEQLEKDEISDDEIKQIKKIRRELQYLEAKRIRCEQMILLNDFITYNDSYMKAKYGSEYKKDIGIILAGNDTQNRKLLYPIKVTHYAGKKYEEHKASFYCDKRV